MTSEILDPASVPESTEYPGTEFVQRFHGGVEGEDPAYYFWAGSDSGTETRLLGFDGDQTPQIDIETLYANATFPNQYPLVFGKQMTPVDVPFDDLLPGLDVMGSLAMQGSVDAWGTVQVPAGTFECLRLHIHGEAELSILMNSEQRLYMLYPQGNWVEVSQASPYYIIGESGYGKSLLDRILCYDSPLETALKAGYLAFDATRNSTIDVAFPLDVVLYRRDTMRMVERRFEEADMADLANWWQNSIIEQLNLAPGTWMADIFGELGKESPIFGKASSE